MTISGYDCWKRKGLSRRRKLENVGAETTSSGSPFQIGGPETLKGWRRYSRADALVPMHPSPWLRLSTGLSLSQRLSVFARLLQVILGPQRSPQATDRKLLA